MMDWAVDTTQSIIFAYAPQMCGAYANAYAPQI